MQEKEQEYAKTTFDDVASRYDEIAFFKISAKYVVEIIQKKRKDKSLEILDVACGTGNVVLECAFCLRDASFDAVDISEGMLAKAKENAKKHNINNVAFHLQDITKLTLEKKYDVITCSYALFFLPEAHKVLSTLVKCLNPEGRVIFTSFLPKAFTPSTDILMPLLEKYGSQAAKEYESDKWENLKRVEDIERLCQMAEIQDLNIETQEIRYGMTVDEWWALMNNTGYKGMLMELTPEGYDSLKQEYYEAMFRHVDMDGEVELIADTFFTVVKAEVSTNT